MQFAEAKSGKQYWSGISGVPLDPKLVRADRTEELKFAQSLPAKKGAALSEVQGQELVSTGWVVINEGHDEHLSYRSCVVGIELNCIDPHRQGVFLTTPLIEIPKLFISMFLMLLYAQEWFAEEPNEVWRLQFLDASWLQLHSDATRLQIVKLSPANELEGRAGKLLRSLERARDASLN